MRCLTYDNIFLFFISGIPIYKIDRPFYILYKIDTDNACIIISVLDILFSCTFEIIELLARVERVLRRYNKVSQTLTAYDIEVDTQSFQVKKAGVEIHLTKKEYEILVMFMRNPNVALFRERIFESVWHEPYYGDSRTVDLHVQRLRKKLGLEDKIVPVYKVGYRLEV